jgi:hypothetical protein
MLGRISALREQGLPHARTAHTRRRPAMRGQPAMAVEEMSGAASFPGSPCSRFFAFVPNVRKRGKALLPALIAFLVTYDPGIQYDCDTKSYE